MKEKTRQKEYRLDWWSEHSRAVLSAVTDILTMGLTTKEVVIMRVGLQSEPYLFTQLDNKPSLITRLLTVGSVCT